MNSKRNIERCMHCRRCCCCCWKRTNSYVCTPAQHGMNYCPTMFRPRRRTWSPWTNFRRPKKCCSWEHRADSKRRSSRQGCRRLRHRHCRCPPPYRRGGSWPGTRCHRDEGCRRTCRWHRWGREHRGRRKHRRRNCWRTTLTWHCWNWSTTGSRSSDLRRNRVSSPVCNRRSPSGRWDRAGNPECTCPSGYRGWPAPCMCERTRARNSPASRDHSQH